MRKNCFLIIISKLIWAPTFSVPASAGRICLTCQAVVQVCSYILLFASKNVADKKIETVPCMTTGKSKTFS
jgi:hypothetical protein